MEALVDIRTARRFADRVQIQPSQVTFEFGDALKMSLAFAQPFGKTWPRAVDLDQIHLIFLDERLETCVFQVRLQFTYLGRFLCGSDQNAKYSFIRTRGDEGVESFLREDF